MKRHNHLWVDIIDFANLLAAANKAQRGKRYRDSVLSFNHNLEKNLLKLKNDLKSKTYTPGGYKTIRFS
jgi:hypothetical protein